MALEIKKRVSDPIHGTIGLTEVECQVISTRAFLRLRNVKQLGLAHYVFPNADYSRFSHSLGVCHVAGKILEALQRSDNSLKDARIQDYRLAGLCHDIGHFPFSHAMEFASEDYYKDKLLDGSDSTESGESTIESYMNHEAAGHNVLTLDKELLAIRGKEYWQEIAGIFSRETPQQFSNLISSDLDADRIDYLMRTAHHTGLPYGHVDVEYLLSQVRLDNKNRVCFSSSALRAAEHLLICRYFDYQQVSYHKTVAGLEWVLKAVLGELFRRKAIACHSDEVKRKITSGIDWCTFDDPMIVHEIRQLAADANAKPDHVIMCNAILHRMPPKLAGEIQYIGERTEADRSCFQLKYQTIENELDELAKEFKVPRPRWHVWKNQSEFTKVASHVSMSESEENRALHKPNDKYEQEIRIHEAGTNDSKAIVEIPWSLMSVLCNRVLYTIRVFVLLADGDAEKRTAIQQKLKDNKLLGWK